VLKVRTLPFLVLLAASAVAGELPSKPSQDPLEPVERRMGDLLNRDRAKEGLPPLLYDPKLAAVARAHSQDMKDNHFSSHESKLTGKVGDRLGRARVPFRVAGENLACCGSIEVAHAALMMSEKHRANILSKEYTRFGVGIVLGDGGWPMCTQVFILPPQVRDVAAIQTEVIEGINKERLARGLRRLVPDDGLTKQALDHSERAARLGKFDELWLEDQLVLDGVRWRVHEAAFFRTDQVHGVILSALAMSERYDSCGVGVIQAPLDSKASGALWVTLICAQKK